MQNGQIALSDGRKLGFADYGDPGAPVIFYFHGWPGTRLEPLAAVREDRPFKARIIALDRPGYGLSSLQPGRRIVDWPADVCSVADSLGIDRFKVLGVSGGGPYAAACAALVPRRVSEALLVSSMGPTRVPGITRGMSGHNRLMLFFTRYFPGPASALVGWGMERMRRRNQFLPPSLVRKLPAVDRQSLSAPGVHQALLRNWQEVFRAGREGALRDGALYAEPWGFEVRDIQVPVRLWHGEQDVVVPATMGRFLAQRIPGCRDAFLPQEGHFSLPLKLVPRVLEEASI